MIATWKSNRYLGVIAGALVLVSIGFLLFGPTGRDDVYKTLWPAKTFAESASIRNYNGDPVEQSSSLLHVVLLGALHRLTGMGLPDLNFIFVLYCGIVVVLMTIALARRLPIRSPNIAGFALALQSIFVYWTFGGLDAVLAAACWLGFILTLMDYCAGGKIGGLIVSSAMVVAARPEGAFIAMGGIALALILLRIKPADASRKEGRHLLISLGLLLAATIVIFCWRYWHSRHWMPQPVIAKAGGFGFVKSWAGLRYLYLETIRHPELLAFWLGWAAGLIAILWRIKWNLPMVLMVAIVSGGLGFVVLSGGDWMENGRFLVPYSPLMVLMVLFGLDRMSVNLGRSIKIVWMTFSLVGLFFTARNWNTGYSLFSADAAYELHPEVSLSYSERFNRVHLRDVAPLLALRKLTSEVHTAKYYPVTILSQQAGMMPYHLAQTNFGAFTFIDLVGLCTADFTECPRTAGRGNFQGGLNMDLVYLFDDWEGIHAACPGIQQPDIVYGLDGTDGALRKSLLKHGYCLYFLQEGNMADGSKILPGLEVEAVEFVMVRDIWSK